MNTHLRAFFAAVLLLCLTPAWALDHTHKAWDDVLKKQVKVIANGNASQFNYKGMLADRDRLKQVLADYSGVTKAQFDQFSKPQQQAFLMNAYNAFTVEKILQKYPNIKSIRDFGSVFGDPWKDKFFKLLGEDSYLNKIEHEILRAPGVYDDPRVHAAVVCASIGCPMLRNEAFVADKLEAQLEDGFKRFLSDRSRNRFNAVTNSLEISKIFEWYKKDFEKGHRGMTSLADTLAIYADLLADKPEHRLAIKGKALPIKYLDYDWSLNDQR